MVDITPFHYYYPQNEMLLDANEERRIYAIRKRQDGVYEMFSRIFPKTLDGKTVGDNKTDEPVIVHYDNFDDYADRYNYWGGYSSTMAFYKSGLEKEVEDLRKMLAEELK